MKKETPKLENLREMTWTEVIKKTVNSYMNKQEFEHVEVVSPKGKTYTIRKMKLKEEDNVVECPNCQKINKEKRVICSFCKSLLK